MKSDFKLTLEMVYDIFAIAVEAEIECALGEDEMETLRGIFFDYLEESEQFELIEKYPILVGRIYNLWLLNAEKLDELASKSKVIEMAILDRNTF